MKNKIFTILIFLFAFISCTKDVDKQNDLIKSDYLVIKANCEVLTKTDISEGVSTWQAGDIISVVYDGVSYEYVAESSGNTTVFTSTAGITNYDSSKSIVAYYPATDASGKINLASEKTVSFLSDQQINQACAPLVGVSQDGNLKNGALNMYFSNIFSVLELRIDAGELPGTAQSITIEPADKTDFDGFMSFSGTVDPSTLALNPAENGTGNAIKVNLPEGTDPKKELVLKLPIGRFTTTSGLKVSLKTTDRSYSRMIYKTGLTSYNKKGDVFYAKHFAKPMYAFAKPGGITSADDLVQFAAAVNAGESIAAWMNSEGKVVLLNDIDMSGVTSWTPIGASVFNWASNVLTCTSGNMFTGYFDGQGHIIKNLKLKCENSTAGAAWGLFGGLGKGAVVENIVFDESCSLELKSTAPTDCGIVAGMVWDARINKIVNNATMEYSGDAKANKRVTMAMVGMAFAETDSVVVKDLVNNAKILASDGGSNQNGGNGVHIAGILGFGTNHISSTNVVAVLNCTNNGDLNSATARTSGIVAAANRYTHIRNSNNYGNNVNSFNVKTETDGSSARIGNLTCVTGAGSAIYDSANYGDAISTTKGAISGCICLVNHATNEFQNMANYGRVITDRTLGRYCGVFFGSCNQAATFTNCIAGGSFGTYNEGNYELTELTAENYWTYIGQIGKNASNVTQENIKFGVK